MENTDRKGFDIATFSQALSEMIATSNSSYNSDFNTYFFESRRTKSYTKEEVQNIINSGSLSQQQILSRDFFNKDGFYRRIIIHYATLLNYTGILIPSPSFGKKLSMPFIQKKYSNALDYIENINVPNFCTTCALRALVDGSYYGVIIESNKNNFAILDLPAQYCRSRFKDKNGNDIIEFDVSYFKTIFDSDSRREALKAYPEEISKHYEKYRKGEVKTKWVFLPTEIGICFPMFGGAPFFLNVIPASIDYDNAVETEKERDLNEIKKILVQRIPHLNDGGFLLEPEEAKEIHRGAVGMLKGNKNVSVLTTYADTDAILSKTSSDTSSNTLEKMVNNIYSQGGVSGQLFASNSNLSLPTSLVNDMSMMMCLARKFEIFLTNMVNKNFSNTNVKFKYSILPVSNYNQKDFIETALKLATNGYSFLYPSLALGISQRDLMNLKDLENDVLKLDKKLIPLSSSFTQSNSSQAGPGAPQKSPQEKAPKTVKNEVSLDKGGSNK